MATELHEQQPALAAPAYGDPLISDHDREDSVKIRSPSVIATVLTYALFPITGICSWFVVDAKTEVIAIQYGRLVGELKEPGWNFLPCWGRQLVPVSTAQQSINLPDIKVADYNGNPVVVSAVVQMTVVDPKKAVLDIENYHQFVRLQAVVVLRQVVAQYPYESDAAHLSLRSNITNINTHLATTLQSLVQAAGCRIDAFRLDELSYAPEIANVMLRKQAAQAMVQARKLIVESAVGISCDAVAQLEQSGVPVSEEEKGELVTKMMAVICSGKDVIPTLSIN